MKVSDLLDYLQQYPRHLEVEIGNNQAGFFLNVIPEPGSQTPLPHPADPEPTALKAGYTKLRNGDWGMRIQGRVTVGDTVTVTKKDGSTKEEVVGSIVWSDDKITLATMDRGHTGKKTFRRMETGDRNVECGECGERVMSGSKCWETGLVH